MGKLGDIFSKVFCKDPDPQRDLANILRKAHKDHLVSIEALSMIEGVLLTTSMRVEEIMVPRSKMVVIEKDAHLSDILPIVISSGHSRFPVIGESKDDIQGILLAKDLLSAVWPKEVFDLKELIRPATFIPQSKRLDVLLREFRANRNHQAIVVDEFGGIQGLITIEDVIEQIVGEIQDEHDKTEEMAINIHDDGTYTVKAEVEIEVFNTYFHTSFALPGVDTIGGVVLHHFGRIPERGEKITIASLDIEILHANSRRIHLLRVTPATKPGL